jgi:hypothetical protein
MRRLWTPGPTVHKAPFDWRDLYLQAVFETDRSRLRARINLAQPALVLSEHELFADCNGRSEWQAITSAFNGLYVLGTCLALERTSAAEIAH